MALRYRVWVRIPHHANTKSWVLPPYPKQDECRRPKKYLEADSESKFEQLDMSSVRAPRRRINDEVWIPLQNR